MSALKALRKTKQASKKTEAPKQVEPETTNEVAVAKDIVMIVNKDRSKTLMELKVPKNWINKRSTDHPDPDTPKARLGGYERSLNQLIRFFHTKKDRDNFVSSLDKKQASKLFDLMYDQYTKGNFNHINLNDYISSWNSAYPNEACETVGKLGSKATSKPSKATSKPKTKPKPKTKKTASNVDLKDKFKNMSADEKAAIIAAILG